MTDEQTPAAGWFLDPTIPGDPNRWRYWNGSAWTEHTDVNSERPASRLASFPAANVPPPPTHRPDATPRPTPASKPPTGSVGGPPPPGAGPMPLPRPSAITAVTFQNVLAPAAAAFGLFLSLISLLMPWVTATTFLTGTVSEGPPIAAGVVVTAMSLMGLGALFVAAKGPHLAIIGVIVSAGINGLVALANLGNAGQASQQSFGLIDVGPGLWALLLGSILAGLSAVTLLVLAERG